MSENKQKYHHGDLRNALIEEGIKMINAGGEEALSLRKLAEKCGVSMAAPYAHFKSKEDMINAIKEYVTDNFTEYLEKAVASVSEDVEDDEKDIEKKILALGNAYVRFFIKNPEYFTFLFSRGYIHLSLDFNNADASSNDKSATGNFKPFNILKDLCTIYFAQKKPGLSDYEKELEIIRIWASVQGLTSIVFMENVKWSHNWEEELGNLLK
jgi:AcrR family transcriptional regulator